MYCTCVASAHIPISPQKWGATNRRGGFCNVSGGSSIIYVIEPQSSHILLEKHSNLARRYVNTIESPRDGTGMGQCSRRGDPYKASEFILSSFLFFFLQVLRLYATLWVMTVRHCKVRRTLLVYSTNAQTHTFAGIAVKVDWFNQVWIGGLVQRT